MAAQRPSPQSRQQRQQEFAERFGDRQHRTHGPAAAAGKVQSPGRAAARGRDYAMRRR